MTTARDFVTKALKKISVLGVGERLSAEDAKDGFEALNDMMASWSSEGALIYTETKETFNLTQVPSYTIGEGQVFNTIIPRDINSVFVTYEGSDTPMTCIAAERYAEICDKTQKGLPSQAYFDSNYPVANIYIWPVGYSGMSLTMLSEKPLSEFASLDAVYAMPPEYRRAILHNLAVEIAGDYERQASPDVKRIASKSLKIIKAQNKKNDKNVMAFENVYGGRGHQRSFVSIC